MNLLKKSKNPKRILQLMKLVGTITASKPIFYYIVYDIISYRLGDFSNILYYIYIYIWEYLVFVTHTHWERGKDF